jgi:hypothetical protein
VKLDERDAVFGTFVDHWFRVVKCTNLEWRVFSRIQKSLHQIFFKFFLSVLPVEVYKAAKLELHFFYSHFALAEKGEVYFLAFYASFS